MSVITGTYYSDAIVGEKEDVSQDLMEVSPGATPFLNSVGLGGAGIAESITHNYYDNADVSMRTTLGTTVNSSATTIVLSEAKAKPGERILMGSEVILLGTSVDNLTFTGCTRSVGTSSGAAHTAADPVVIMNKPAIQGADASTADASIEPRLVTNYVEGFERVAIVPDQSDVANRHGRPGTAFDDKVQEQMKAMRMQMEAASIMGVKSSAPAPSSGTQGAMDGIWERVVGTNTTAMGSVDFSWSSVKNAVEDIADYYDPGESLPAVLICPLRQTFIFSEWQFAHVQVQNGDPAAEVYGVNVRRLSVGPMMIDIIGHNRLYDSAVLYQPKYIKPLYYKNGQPTFEMLARTGRYKKGLVSCDMTLEVGVPEAHYTFSGLATS